MYTGMLKRVLILCILCAAMVFAQQNVYSDIPLDNVHILRLQAAADELGGNVTLLRESMEEWQTQRAGDVQALRSDVAQFQVSIQSQIADIKNQIANLEGPSGQYPASASLSEVGLPSYVIVLLAANIVLLIIVIILIFWLREQYFVHRETHKEDHIHPAPKELVEYVTDELDRRKSVKDIRMQLIDKGWTPSIIEHAIHAAKEK